MESLGTFGAKTGAGLAVLLAVLLVGVSPAAGQVATPPPPVAPPAAPPATREEIQRTPIGPDTRAPSRLTVEGGIERAPCPLADPRFKDVTVTITEAQFVNLRVVSPETLRPAYADFLGKPQPIAVVCEIRDAAATILRRQGYLAAVQVPAQRIENGVVRFDVLMAKLVAVQVRGDAGKAERLIAGYLDRIKEQEVFNEREAERYLLLARDLPGYDVRLTLRPAGTVPGEVVGEVTVVRQRIAVDVNVQNYGSHDVGRIGGLLRAEVYDLLGSGDRLTAGIFSTADVKEQQVLQLGYDRRIGSEGLTLSGRFTYAWTKPDLGAQPGTIRSRTLVASGEVGYPFVRTQSTNLRGAIGFDYINQNVSFNGVRFNQDHIRVAYARADFDAIDRPSINSVTGYSASEPRWRLAGSLEARKGLDIFDATKACGSTFCAGLPVTPSRAEGRPTAALARFAGVAEYRPIPTVTFSLSPRAQYSGRALLSYEEFSGGNYTVGRGYDPGSIIGDSGIGVQAELRVGRITPQERDAFAFQPYVFYDKAWVWNRNRPPVSLVGPLPSNPQDLSSAGVGVRAAYGDRARIDVSFAKALERTPFQTKRNDGRLLVSFTTRLLPWTR